MFICIIIYRDMPGQAQLLVDKIKADPVRHDTCTCMNAQAIL